MFRSILIKDTTPEERQQIVDEALGVVDGQCDGCAPGILKMYDKYVSGEMELSEVNASFRRGYCLDHGSEEKGESCMMMN